MFNFKEELMKNAQENTPEKIMERKKVQTINELFIIIQTICLYRSKKGLTYAICDIRELLQECESYEKELFLKSSGEGFEKAAAQFQMVLKNPDELKLLLEKKLNEVGLNDYEFIPKKIPLFDVSYKTTENSTGVKLLYGVINLLSSEANLDVEETTKQKTKKIGEQIMNYELQIRW